MNSKAISMALIAKNRIGLVSDLTKFIYDKGANIHKSRMIAYDTKFIISLSAISPNNFDLEDFKLRFTDEIESFSIDNMFSMLDLKKTKINNTYNADISISLSDTPGIIHKTTHILSENKININELQSDVDISAFTNAPLFKLDINADIPDTLNISNLYSKIIDYSDQIGYLEVKKN